MIEKTIKGIKYRLDEENLTAEVIYKNDYEGDIIIPEIVELENVAYRVTSIGEHAFQGCIFLTSMVIGNGVTSIGDKAFDECDSLTSITFNGTKAQWKGIKLGDDWKKNVPTKVIHCTDGDICFEKIEG